MKFMILLFWNIKDVGIKMVSFLQLPKCSHSYNMSLINDNGTYCYLAYVIWSLTARQRFASRVWHPASILTQPAAIKVRHKTGPILWPFDEVIYVFEAISQPVRLLWLRDHSVASFLFLLCTLRGISFCGKSFCWNFRYFIRIQTSLIIFVSSLLWDPTRSLSRCFT